MKKKKQLTKKDLEGKFVIAYDTICDGWQCMLDENDTPENAIADLKKMVDEQLQQPYFVAPKKRDKPKMDMVMLKKYEEAIRIGDVKTITEIENNYDVIA